MKRLRPAPDAPLVSLLQASPPARARRLEWLGDELFARRSVSIVLRLAGHEPLRFELSFPADSEPRHYG